LEPSDGQEQNFIEDCSNCCRPLRIHAHYDIKSREFSTDASREI
jgi:hypothetical protein